MPRFLLVLDTPGIKSFVFGTDSLAEVRGASALLDRLNRLETVQRLRDALPHGAECETVFANGGAGQFILQVPDRDCIERALNALACTYREETGGEVRIVWGLAPWDESTLYRSALADAHAQLRVLRETASPSSCIPQIPFMLECSSTSHLPARPEPFVWGGESLLLSDSARRKRDESRWAGRSGPWAGWMESLAGDNLPWPARERWSDLRAADTVELGKARSARDVGRRGYVGLVYADGNAMGRLVQELDSPETCRAFSSMVDEGVRNACFAALGQVCAAEVADQRRRPEHVVPLPADTLLLGGDDLLVLLPAAAALPFALHVCADFENRIGEQIRSLPANDPVRSFFDARLYGRGMTISCGVALAPAKYPFYLLLDLAEDLLRSAKDAGSRDPDRRDHWAPAYIDFHLVVGSMGADLAALREDDYHTGRSSRHSRTLRPYRLDRLNTLRTAVGRLQEARLPRSKLQDLFDAALLPAPGRAEARSRELFGRLRQTPEHPERQALWEALCDLGMGHDFPWCWHDGRTATALADLVEAYDFFPSEEHA